MITPSWVEGSHSSHTAGQEGASSEKEALLWGKHEERSSPPTQPTPFPIGGAGGDLGEETCLKKISVL